MKRFALIFAIAVLFGTSQVRAQLSELVGKVVDADGKAVAGAEVTAVNKVFPDRIQKGVSDKRGSFTVTGLLYAATAQEWTVSIQAPGFVPVSAHVVARDSTKTLYLEDKPKLSAKSPSFDVKVRPFAEVRIDFSLRPGDAAAEASPAPVVPVESAAAAAGGGAADTYGEAIAMVRAGDAEGSVDVFKKAIEEKPDDWERRDVFAKVLLKLDRQGEATIQANKAAQIAPERAAPYITLTEIYLARGLPDKAAEAIAKAQQLEPENMKVLERAAAVAANAGRLDEAIALNEKVLANRPTDTEVMVSLADLYNRKKLPKKAEEMLDRVRTADPKNAYRTFYNLGVVIENRDDATDADHRKAIEAFREAIKLKQDYALAHRDLGFVLLRTGDLANARKELQQYVDLDPRARDAAEIKETIKSLAGVK